MNRLAVSLLICVVALSARAAPQVQETYFFSTGEALLTVNNLGEPTSIVAFAVANNNATSVYNVQTNAGAWAAGIMTASGWNAGSAVIANAFGITLVPQFESVFPGYSRAVVYYAESLLSLTERAGIAGLGWSFLDRLSEAEHANLNASSKPILAFNGITGGFGFFSSTPGSPFAALTSTTPPNPTLALVTGTTIDTLIGTPPIPEPSNVVLMLAGLGSIAAVLARRRRRYAA